MALRECPDCQAQVSDAAPVCPKCGRPMGKDSSGPKKVVWSKKVKIAIGVCVLLILALLFGEKKPSKAPQNQNATTEQKAPELSRKFQKRVDDQLAAMKKNRDAGKPEMPEYKASKIYSDYKSNEVAADKKYKGQYFFVSGTLSAISKDFTGDPYITLAADGYGFMTVRADMFPEQLDKSASAENIKTVPVIDRVAELQSGQRVVLGCKGDGFVVMSPILRDCIIEPEGKSK